MKKHVKKTAILLFLLIGFALQGNAQSIKVLGADVANGALTGLGLGSAAMALQNSPDRAPLRVGLGMGVLYGIGTGIYDNSRISKGEQLYISGTFNDGKNSTVLVLLDTIYGAAGGAAVGGAIALIGNEPVIDGLQYGSGAGAWLGFGFGLIDSFVLSEGPEDLRSTAMNDKAKGIIEVTPTANENISLGFLNPSVVTHKSIDAHSVQMRYSMSMQFVNMKVGF